MLEKMLRMSALLDRYSVLLTDKQREIATDYFLNDLSLGEIAEAQGISRQAVYDTLVRAERAMEGYEAQFGLVARSEELHRRLANWPRVTARRPGLCWRASRRRLKGCFQSRTSCRCGPRSGSP